MDPSNIRGMIINVKLRDAIMGKFTLSAIYRLKSPESGYERGVKCYQNLEYSKIVFGSKHFFWSDPGARKVGRAEKLSISKFGFFLLWTKIGALK